MTRSKIFHALGLHMHQPPGNLRLLIDTNPWEAEQIVRCYERPVRYAAQYRDVARLHIGFSGVLLEQLLDPGIVDRYRHILDIPEMLHRYAQADNIELIGMGYCHPIFPLIPRADWPEQLERGKEVVERAFGRTPRGFWPPEMAFCMEMVPALVEAGYDYVVVDGVHVRPEDGIADVFRPYLICHDGVCITAIPRDRDVSNAQQSGLDATWFQNEVRWRVGGSARPQEPRLVTTWSDGENGGWFRQTHEGSGFFGHFFAPYMEHFRGGEYPIAPISIADYLKDHPPVAQAQVQTGAWNVGSNAGNDLSHWAGSETQREAVLEVHRLSKRYWDLHGRSPVGEPREPLERARRLILEAETSCFLFWGDAWLPYLYERTGPAAQALDEAQRAQGGAGAGAAQADPSPVASPTARLGSATCGSVADAQASPVAIEAAPEAGSLPAAAAESPALARAGAAPGPESASPAEPERALAQTAAAPRAGEPGPSPTSAAGPVGARPREAVPDALVPPAAEPGPGEGPGVAGGGAALDLPAEPRTQPEPVVKKTAPRPASPERNGKSGGSARGRGRSGPGRGSNR